MLKKILLSLFILCSLTIYGQNLKLTGNVTDELNEALIGATISIKGTSRGTITDIDGNYQIEVSPGDQLVFSMIGMTTEEVVFRNQKSINVVLTTDTEILDEIVVIGYQTIKKADLTGAVSIFNTENIKNTIVTGNVGDALGTLPGVMARTSGNPGKEGDVLIRGTGTFGNSAPLYVVDGIVSGANRDFNFNDIESIQVLKDASAAAIYGSRAGNGVIIITTKQGKKGDMKIDVSSRLTLQWLPKYELMNRDEWIKLNDLAFINGGKEPANHFDGNTDWQEEVFKNGIVQDHNISFSGGSDKNTYFISANYQSNSGTTVGADSKRYTIRSNTSTYRDFGENVRFSVGENITLSHFGVNELNSTPMTAVYRMLPTISVYDPDNERGGYGYGDAARDVTFGSNPIAQEDFEDTRNSNLRIRGNAFTELEVLKMFKYRFNWGFDFSNDKYRHLRKDGDYTYNQQIHPSSLDKRQAQSRGFVFDNTLEFNKNFGKHSINALLGSSYQTSSYERLVGVKTNVLTSGDEYFTQLDAVMDMSNIVGYKQESKLFSLFGRMNYNFDERYLFSFTLRRDESSKFPKDNRVGYFPSISGGWRISNEKFFNVSWINDLKIRGNYGVLGTSNNGYYDYIASMNLAPQVVFGNDAIHSGMIQSELVNTSLQWEEMSQLNLGFDATLFKNRFSISTDYFIKKSSNVLTQLPISMFLGNALGNPWVNAASIKNTGFEISTTWKDQINKDMDYSIGVNFSYLKNKLVDMGNGNPNGEFNQNLTKAKVGNPIGQWYLIKTDGLFRTQEEIDSYKTSNGTPIKINERIPELGDVRYVDFNDDGQITDADRQYCGENMPKYELGMNLGFRYKDFDLQMVLSGAFGHKVYNGSRSTIDYFADNSNYRKNYDPWTPENPNAKDPRPIFGDTRNGRANQDRWLENGNYLKFKQIAIGYNVPKTILGKYIANVRLYVNAQNLITITSYNGLDPEFLNGSLWNRSYDNSTYPNPKGVTFGAQITF